MSSTRDRRLRRLAVARGVWGIVLLSAPDPVIDRVPGAQATSASRNVARALGARQLVQSALSLGGSQIARRAWWVDALHSLTMVGLALWAPASRRLASADAFIAAGFAGTTYAANRS